MSAIFGILHLDGRPVEPAHLEAMRAAMAEWGPDGDAIWTSGSIGLGHLLLHNTPESLGEDQPIVDRDRRVVLSASARLDNRSELRELLAAEPAQRENPTDGELILQSFRRWGTSCPRRLIGDWAAAIWDEPKRELFLARDHFGPTGVHYFRSDRLFVFASALRALLVVPGVPRRLNPNVIAGSGFLPRDPSETQYAGIRRLLPAEAMLISTHGEQRWRYWDPRDAPDVRLGSDEEYVEAFREIYSEAVRCRLRSHRPVATMLSGGLDSGSIAAIASRELKSSSRRLTAFTAAPAFDVTDTTPAGRSGDETGNVELLCRHLGNVDLVTVRAETRRPVEALREAFEIHALPVGHANYVWALDLLKAARHRGFGSVLDGWGGNLTVSWAGNRGAYLSSLLRRGSLGAFATELNARRLQHEQPWRRVVADAVQPLIPPGLWHRARVQRLHSRRVVTPARRRELRRSGRAQVVDPDVVGARNPQLLHFFRGGSGVTALACELAAAFQLEARQPAMDTRVIEFCQGLPLDQFIWGGQDRLLIKRAMTGLMPESVLWDRRRGLQSADAAERLRHDHEVRPALDALEASTRAHDHLDVRGVRRAFDAIADELDARSVERSNIVLSALGHGMFFESLETADDGRLL